MSFRKVIAVAAVVSFVFLMTGCEWLLGPGSPFSTSTDITISGTITLPASVTPGHGVWVGLVNAAPISAPSNVSTWAAYQQLVIAPGASASYSLTGVAPDKYVVVAFYDVSDNGIYDTGEPYGGYPIPYGNPLYNFTADFSQANITIIATATPPAISLSPTSLSFFATTGGANPSTGTVSITNTGGGTLSGLAAGITYGTGASDWLTTTWNTTTAPATLSVQPATGALTAGTYTATVAVSSSVSGTTAQDVVISFTLSAPGQPPSIRLSSSSLSFSAPVGGASPSAQTVSVDNVGGGTLSGLSTSVSYGTGSGSGWLTATLNSTTAPATLTVQPTTGSLAVGTYTATVIVSSSVSGTQENISVSFMVSQTPVIGLSSSSLSFFAAAGGANPLQGMISVTNTGGGTLSGLSKSVSYGSGTGWLSNVSVSDTAPGTLTAQATTGTLAAGTYTATITVSSSISGVTPQNVSVTFIVSSQTQSPAIGLQYSSLSFSGIAGGADPTAQTVSVSNAGGGTLSDLSASVSYTSGSDWLTAMLSSTTAPATLTLQPSTGSLAEGTYTATVAVASSIAGVTSQNLNVTFTIAPPPPVIDLQPTSRSFSATEGGTNPAAQTVAVTNAGSGTLIGLATSVSYQAGSGWLAATLDKTTAPAVLTVQPTTGSLVAGVYSATVIVYSSAVGVAPQSLSVTFSVAQRPKINLASSGLSFSATTTGADPTAQTVTITNGGGGVLSGLAASVSYGTGTGWLAATLDFTTAPAILTVQPSKAGLAVGDYFATIAVTSSGASNSPQSLSIAFTVAQGVLPPSIGLSANNLNFTATVGDTGNPVGKTVTITNTGGGTLDGLVAPISYGGTGSGWLAATLDKTTATAVLTVQPTLGSLAAGDYTATIAVTSTAANNSPQNVSVTFTVAPQPPKIQLASTSLNFTGTQGGANPTSQSVLVTNIGGGSLTGLSSSITFGSGSGWLGATINPTTAPAILTVQPYIALLTAGTYTATISISSGVASNSPQTVSVTITITPPPPTVTTTSPLAGTTGVVTTVPQIIAVFGTAMDPATITTSTFTVSPNVTGTVSYNSSTRYGIFVPSAALAPLTTYTATITTGAKSAAGVNLAAAYSWTFTTGTVTAQIQDPSFTNWGSDWAGTYTSLALKTQYMGNTPGDRLQSWYFNQNSNNNYSGQAFLFDRALGSTGAANEAIRIAQTGSASDGCDAGVMTPFIYTVGTSSKLTLVFKIVSSAGEEATYHQVPLQVNIAVNGTWYTYKRYGLNSLADREVVAADHWYTKTITLNGLAPSVGVTGPTIGVGTVLQGIWLDCYAWRWDVYIDSCTITDN